MRKIPKPMLLFLVPMWLVVFLMVGLGLVGLANMSTPARSQNADSGSTPVPEYVTDMGPLPDDICVLNGLPQILSVANIPTAGLSGDLSLSYIRLDGDIVTIRYQKYGGGFKPTALLVWAANYCPTQTE